jgi:dienelactone hydrolase
MNRLKISSCRAAWLAAWLLSASAQAFAQSWTVQTIATRVADGKPVSVAFAMPASAQGQADTPPVRHVLVYPQPGAPAVLKLASGNTPLNLAGPWVRAATQLKTQGVAVVYVDPPSDAGSRGLSARPSREAAQDFAAVAKQVQLAYAGAQMHLAGFGVVAPLLDMGNDLDGFGKILVASSNLRNNRSSDWSQLRKPVLMLHAPSAQCDAAPFLEAQLLAKRSRFTLVQVGYDKLEDDDNCGRNSQHVLQGQESVLAKTVADWLDGKEAPPVIGHPNPQVAWREEIVTYAGSSTFGSNLLEATLLLPEASRFGAGPYPVLVFNHGDVDLGLSYVKNKSRIREMQVAREFLQLGMAVLMPARRGAGMSEGTIPTGFSRTDADPTYKARVQSADILPALAWLKSRPELDASRMVLSGQSAGGYCTMYLASQNPAGLLGAIDFSGGRNDITSASGPSHLNPMMVSGFAEFGKTTRVPTLWVFAENDTRYTAHTIRASHEAFQAAGGKARLLLSPPIEGDGHHIYHKPAFWRADVKAYLQEIGALSHAK